MDRLAALISPKRSTNTILTCGKDVYMQITASFPAGFLQFGGKIIYHGLEVRLDESKEAGYAALGN